MAKIIFSNTKTIRNINLILEFNYHVDIKKCLSRKNQDKHFLLCIIARAIFYFNVAPELALPTSCEYLRNQPVNLRGDHSG